MDRLPLLLTAFVVVAGGCRHQETRPATTAVIVADRTDPTIAYAADELRALLESTTDFSIVENLHVEHLREAPPIGARQFILKIDSTLPPGVFAAACHNGGFVTLTGHDAAGVLHAVYAMLERAGITFDVTGPILPKRLHLERLDGWSTLIRPAVARRGIRQHINFPMDISSYPLPEARDYIRNLARLRMNHITFHGYKGQWVPVRLSQEEILAGGFFYGQRHEIPDHPILKNVLRNRRTFVIPEIEPIDDRPAEKSRAAVEWLGEVMRCAKSAGMTIAFSLEPPGESIEDGVAACRAVIAAYPLIDSLEVMTPECGGYQETSLATKEYLNLVSTLFDPATAADPALVAALAVPSGKKPGPDDAVERFVRTEGLVQLPPITRDLARNIAVVRELKKTSAERSPALTLGVYSTCHRTLRASLAMMRRHVPDDVGFAFLPAHGGRATAASVRAMDLTPDDWRRTMFYGWIEFDGNMYLQQNSIEGTRELVALKEAVIGGGQPAGIALNHWRTAENRTSLRYAALAFLHGPLDPATVYREYAGALGIGAVDRYARAMAMLDNAETRARDTLFNIGFCYAGCWLGPPGLRWIRTWKTENVRTVRDEYRAVREALERSLAETASVEGRTYLRFLINRLSCSVIHLETIEHLMALRSICDDAKLAPPEKEVDRKAVLDGCRAAAERAEAYMRLHAEMIVDRGCEGTLISYYATIPAFIAKTLGHFGGGGSAVPVAPRGPDIMPPPDQGK